MKSMKLFSQFALSIAFVLTFSEGVPSAADVQQSTGFVWTLIAAFLVFFCNLVLPSWQSVLPNQKIPLIYYSEAS